MVPLSICEALSYMKKLRFPLKIGFTLRDVGCGLSVVAINRVIAGTAHQHISSTTKRALGIYSA